MIPTVRLKHGRKTEAKHPVHEDTDSEGDSTDSSGDSMSIYERNPKSSYERNSKPFNGVKVLQPVKSSFRDLPTLKVVAELRPPHGTRNRQDGEFIGYQDEDAILQPVRCRLDS